MVSKPHQLTGPIVRGGEAKGNAKGKVTGALTLEEGEEKGDLLIRNIFTQGTDSIHNMHVINTDAISYQ